MSFGGERESRGDEALFGIVFPVPAGTAYAIRDSLRRIAIAQLDAAGMPRLRARVDGDELPSQDELDEFRTWFDPTAKGERLRNLLSKLPALRIDPDIALGEAVFSVSDSRYLVTPEGWLLLRCLNRALQERQTDDPVRIPASEVRSCTAALMRTYRSWTRRRIVDVVGLLTSETSTLRPPAAGLLLTLLINRNTAPERAMRRPSDPATLAMFSAAIAAPALAYAEAMGGRAGSGRSIDLYRGWALGELRRRLGAGLHIDDESGIWLDETAAEEAMARLVADVRRRDSNGRSRVHNALEATLGAYEKQRPKLAALGLAFERPGNTARLLHVLAAAADDDAQRSERSGG